MSALNSRLDHMYPGLSARERAVLVLEAVKADEKPDELIYSTMPDDQAAAFNGYIRQVRGVALGLDLYATMLEHEIAIARRDYLLLGAVCSWAFDRSELLSYIAFQTHEPCTEAEFEGHLSAARAEELSLEIAVDAVIEARGLWTDAEREYALARDPASRRLARPIQAELQELVDGGRLVGRGRGARLRINAGSLHDWLDQPTPVPAGWGDRYEVVGEEDIASRRQWRERIRDRARSGPLLPVPAVPALEPSSGWPLSNPDLPEGAAFVRLVGERLRAELVRLSGAWGALETALAEVSHNLGGHDPAHPSLRATVEQASADLEELREHATSLIGHVGVAEPDGEVLLRLRALAHESQLDQ